MKMSCIRKGQIQLNMNRIYIYHRHRRPAPPITTGEAEALIQRVGITAEQFKEVLAALAPNRKVVVGDVAGGPTGGKAGPAGSQGRKKKVRRSQKKKATKPNGKAMMADALSRLEEEDESASFEWMSAFDRLGDPKSKKPRTSAFERLQDTRSARKGDLRDTLKEKKGESTATSKVGSEERRITVRDKGATELWKMYEQLEKRLDAQNPYRQAVFSEVTPFSKRIMSCSLADNFKTPQIKAYNGTTDPQDHLARFGANVVMYAYPEEIKCRCFLATLEGQACEWFHKLPKGSIDKWSDLAHKFLEHFTSSRRQKLPFSHLLNVKIRKGEQLREFINRWEMEARDVQGADDQALIAMLQAALPQGDVRKELRRNPLSTYQEMLARAKYLALEEEYDEPPVRKEKKSGPPVAEGKKRKDYGKGPNPTGYHANRHLVHAKEEGRPRAEPAEEVEEVSLDPVEPERKVKVGKTLPPEVKEQLLEVLRAFKVLFAWGPEDMPGVDPKIICHRLAVDPTHKPVKQEKCFLSSERREFVTKQVTTLQSIGHIREVRYPECPNAPSRVSKWGVFLGSFQIEFKPRPAIKGQALADFVVECTAREVESSGEEPEGNWWTVYTDGLSATDASGGGVVAISPEGFKAYYSVRFRFKVSNNEAEYEALLCGLRLAASLKAERIQVRCDSKLVVGHVTGEFEAKDERMKKYRDTALELLNAFEAYRIEQAMTQEEELLEPSISPGQVLIITLKEEPDWIDEITMYILDGSLPIDPIAAKVVKRRAPSYTLECGRLYKRSYNGTLLRCLRAAEAQKLMEQIHEGICSAHQGAFTMSRKVENTNRTIMDGLKKNIMECKSAWVEEVPYILWTYRTTPRKATGETPFSLTYGFEARAPAETSLLNYRVETFDAQGNEENLMGELHLIDERRERAYMRAENYRRQVKSYHDQRVRPRQFKVGHWVLRKREVSRPTNGGKFAKSFEGPYIIK
ncbi:unnamed protein product [Cuscuta campestris]|uniref:Uncharacterized protein n=1 Tax=Cuscuta campestris TaxID=132261 RepID=A0A484MDK5_9ASTE|nr:unnamed protein product [Cuscuta campestris]